MLLLDEIYPQHSCNAIRNVLYKIPDGEKLLCKVLAVFNHSIALRWQIEDDPYAKQFHLTDATTEEDKNQPRVGEKLYLKAQRNEKNELFFLINNKYIGSIIVDKANYPKEATRNRVKETLHELPEGQVLLCKIRRLLSNFRAELRWAIEEDPSAKNLYSHLII